MDVTRLPVVARRHRLLAAAIIGALMIASCSSDATTATTSVATTSTSVPATTAPASSERADDGPADIDAYIATIGGTVEEGPKSTTSTPDGKDCATAFVPDELLVYVSAAARVANTTAAIVTAIEGAVRTSLPNEQLPEGSVARQLATSTDREPLSRPVFRIALPEKSGLRASTVQAINETLANSIPNNGQLTQVAADVDHIGPFLPVGKFSPADQPLPATKEDAPQPAGAQHRVLVVDYPATPVNDWGHEWVGSQSVNHHGNDQVDFVAGHGTFVTDIIEHRAPGTVATLQGVVHQASATGDAWPGFLFDEYDLVSALEAGLRQTQPTPPKTGYLPVRMFAASFHVINFSLGTVDCAGSQHPVLEPALRDILDTTSYTPAAEFSGETYFVAAVGNDGTDNPGLVHFPAAFAALPASDTLAAHTIAVAAADGGQLAPYSNNECWANAQAPGTAVAAFPWLHSDQLATWNGTSFSTARVTAALVHQPGDVASTWAAAAPNAQIGGDAAAVRVKDSCPP